MLTSLVFSVKKSNEDLHTLAAGGTAFHSLTTTQCQLGFNLKKVKQKMIKCTQLQEI